MDAGGRAFQGNIQCKGPEVTVCLMCSRNWGFPVGSGGKECPRCRRSRFDPWVRKIPWRREWLPVFYNILTWRIPWTEKAPGYSPWGHKESDTAERLTLCGRRKGRKG